MRIQSMTGFARQVFTVGSSSYVWELKSVNGRGLELRFRLPPGFDGLEPSAREAVRSHLSRGSCYLNLQEDGGGAEAGVTINEAALRLVLERAKRLAQEDEVQPARADGLLSLRGVIVQGSNSERAAEGPVAEAAVAALHEALKALVTTRLEEGERLRAHLTEIIDRIEALVEAAEARLGGMVERLRARIREQVEFISSETQLDEGRLYQEALMVATKADIREEIDRLKAHIAEARTRLAEGGVIGRRLDFLSQEFNREANTLCSKSSDHETTAIGLDLKSAIDQFREQVQNLE
ncbi:YicC family protein [Afifella sp. H1R]|uniref:YicC/YloC family endoribonuclease n=1 Tax=Afifella sp. H1R TaxID=2908841 RepID=UPI001F1ABA21|nr:YicC/YloC family endoribonuclease [Afifella sp. H1R]MCF1503522.1 YicC family protein [Afifella sp. H1R]